MPGWFGVAFCCGVLDCCCLFDDLMCLLVCLCFGALLLVDCLPSRLFCLFGLVMFGDFMFYFDVVCV